MRFSLLAATVLSVALAHWDHDDLDLDLEARQDGYYELSARGVDSGYSADIQPSLLQARQDLNSEIQDLIIKARDLSARAELFGRARVRLTCLYGCGHVFDFQTTEVRNGAYMSCPGKGRHRHMWNGRGLEKY